VHAPGADQRRVQSRSEPRLMRSFWPKNRTTRDVIVVALILSSVVAIIAAFGFDTTPTDTASSYGRPAGASKPQKENDSYSDLLAAAGDGNVGWLTLDARTNKAEVVYKDAREATVTLPPDNGALLSRLASEGTDVTIKGQPGAKSESLLAAVLPTLIVVLAIAGVFVFIRRRAAKDGNGMLGPNMGLRQSTELTTVPGERFRDIAGCDEAVEELAEIVQYYLDPSRFDLLGARLPSGIMLHGDPCTGKTLLAKALAGEAGPPFYAASGSDFVEKFVGVGASRVRELFAKARRHPEGAVI